MAPCAPSAYPVPVLAHRDTDALIAERCMRCLKLLREALGEQEMEGTDVVRPTQTVERSTSINAGGRTIDILYYGPTSAPGSIAVFDRASGVLFGGGMVSIDRIPDVKDADLGQWRAALRSLQATGAARIVPGEGPVSSPSRLPELERYLELLPPAVQKAFDQRTSLGEAASAAPVPAYRGWALYDSVHRKNVEQLYLRLEKAALNPP
jgi:glyoxylase-like metal-dependent hydrolase (beta-lactamase superfamily II)